MSEVIKLTGPKLYIAYTDWHWATMQMARFRAGADFAIYAKTTSRSFCALQPGERFVFKAAKDQIADGPIFGDARYVDCIQMTAKTAWRLFEDAVGHPTLDAWLSNLANYRSGSVAQIAKDETLTMIVLEKARFLAPVDWLPPPLDWPARAAQSGKIYYEASGEGAEIAQTLDHILGQRAALAA